MKKRTGTSQILHIICYVALALQLITVACQRPESHDKTDAAITTDTTWKSLSLREKIGQVVCLKYSKQQMREVGNGSLQSFFDKYPVGSLFLANWEIEKYVSRDSMSHEYRRTVNELSKASKFPLLFSEDFESGVGSSMPDYTPLVTEMGLGATNSKLYASWYGKIMSSELRSIGINWVLNPVADLVKNPFNYITNVRSIGDDVNRAVKMLPAQVKAMQNNKLAATAKHFPGDGTDYINQHLTTSQMKLSVEEWKQQHGKVFQTLIDSGLMVIMPGHISFPAYQKEKLNGEYLPATLSKELLTSLLKGEMGFKGVIVSDALNMAGIAEYYPNQLETEIECFKAGTDILLWPSLAFVDSVEARILRKEIPMERLNDAVSRVWNMKKQLGLLDKGYMPIKPISEKEMEEHKQKAEEIAQHSLTLLSNKNKVLPIDTLTSKNILLCVVSENDQTKTFSELKEQLTSKGFKVTVQQNLPFYSSEERLPEIEKQYDKILFLFYSTPGSITSWGEQSLTMWSANKLSYNKVICIGFSDPFINLIYMPRIWCRINCYNADKYSQRMLVEGLMGKFEFTGISPVEYPLKSR
jgi:beta-N-acetylhexosaminidase